MHKTVDLVDYIGIYLAVTKVVGKGEMRIMVTALGWGTAQIIGTKLLPLWMGARGTEFDWKYIQSAFTSNIDLVRDLLCPNRTSHITTIVVPDRPYRRGMGVGFLLLGEPNVTLVVVSMGLL